MENASLNQAPAPSYRTGTAARMAGIPVATLRVWELRYQVVGPQLSPSGHRRYTAADISRLALIKALVDLGHPIGTLAHLPLAALNQMRAATAKASAAARSVEPRSSMPRVALVGESLVAQVESAAQRFPLLQIAASCADLGQATVTLDGVTADLLVIELPSLREGSVQIVGALTALVGARRAIVSYRFATHAAVHELRRRGHVVAHAPIDLGEIASLASGAQLMHESARTVAPAASSPPRFDERTLAQFAQTSTAIACECPRHVVDLLLSLGAFERYSAECESRSPADAELHRYLASVAGTARTLFEEALVRVAQAEGIALGSPRRTDSLRQSPLL
jgi:MerR family transcriptional regulator, light-induced transcriptional regulator